MNWPKNTGKLQNGYIPYYYESSSNGMTGLENTKFDQYLLGNTSLSQQELNGFTIFMSEDKGDCFHCHGSNNNPLWTDNDFHNNGLDTSFNDLGLGAVTGDPNDNGKFKSPSLRNSG